MQYTDISHFHPTLIFSGVARSLPLKWSTTGRFQLYTQIVEVTNTLAYYNCQFYIFTVKGPYSQLFVFFMTYKWIQKASVRVPIKPFNYCVMYHSSLLCSFVSYEEMTQHALKSVNTKQLLEYQHLLVLREAIFKCCSYFSTSVN